MTAQIIPFPVSYKSPEQRNVDRLVEVITRVMADPRLAKDEHERAFADALRRRVANGPPKP